MWEKNSYSLNYTDNKIFRKRQIQGRRETSPKDQEGNII